VTDVYASQHQDLASLFWHVSWLKELQSALPTTTLLPWSYAFISTGFAQMFFFF